MHARQLCVIEPGDPDRHPGVGRREQTGRDGAIAATGAVHHVMIGQPGAVTGTVAASPNLRRNCAGARLSASITGVRWRRSSVSGQAAAR